MPDKAVLTTFSFMGWASEFVTNKSLRAKLEFHVQNFYIK